MNNRLNNQVVDDLELFEQLKPFLEVQYDGGCDNYPCINCKSLTNYYFNEGNRCPFDGAYLIFLLSSDTIMRTGNVLTGEAQNQEVKVESFICPRCKHLGGNFRLGNFTDVEPVYSREVRGVAYE